MKKITAILALTALVVLGCDKKDNSGTLSLPNPPAKEFHGTIEVSNSPSFPSPSVDNSTDQLKDITISSGGHGVAGFQLAGPVDFVIETPTRAPRTGAKFKIDKVGEFTILEVEEFAVLPKGSKSLGTVTFGFKSVKDEPEFSFSGSLVEEPYADSEFCTDWTVDEIYVALDGDRVGKTFKGCNLNEISNYLIGKGVKIKEQPASYTVSRLMLAESGKFGVLFTGERPYFGAFTLGKDGAFSYTLSVMNHNDPIIAGTATGSISIVKGGKVRLGISGSLSDTSGKPYSVEVVFFLLPEK